MAKVKLNLRGLSTLEVIALGRQIVKALTGNKDFPNPQPPLATLTTGLDELDTAQADLQKARQDTATKLSIKDEKQASIVALLRQSAAFVESVVGDNEKLILSAGMGVRSPASPTQPASAPGNLTATESDHEAELDLHWDAGRRGVTGYEVQRSPDPPTPTSWVHETISTKSSVTIKGLTSGTRYWFRVRAVTSGGQSGWSDPATKIAP
jgi:hypothetical protein